MKRLIILFSLIVTWQSFSQNNPFSGNGFEIGRIDYMNTPNLGNVDMESLGISFGFPLILKKGLLVTKFSYKKYDLFFKDDLQLNRVLRNFNEIYNIQVSLLYMRPLKNNWSFSALASPTLSSTLKTDITIDDFIYNTFAGISKKWEKEGLQTNLTFGLAFGTVFGKPRLFPMLSFNKELNEKFRYSIGLPSTGVFYKINTKSSIDFLLSPEGLFANNSSSTIFNDQNSEIIKTKLQFNSLKIGLNYHLKFEDNWFAHFNGGYIPISNMEVLDEDNNSILPVNTSGSAYFNLGISFNINPKKIKNEKNK